MAYQWETTADVADAWLRYVLRLDETRPADCPFEPLPTLVLQQEGALPSASGLPEDVAPPAWIVEPIPPLDDADLALIYPHLLRAAPPDHRYEYRNGRGELVQLVLRWNAGTVPWAKGKVVRPVCYARPADAPEQPPRLVPSFAPRVPIFNAGRMAATIGSPVLWVEGERAAIAAEAYVPQGWTVTTCAGGLVRRADAAAIASRPVVIWPDADEAGARYAERVVRLCRAMGARAVVVIDPPPGAPQGWDLADDPAEAGFTAEAVKAKIAEALGVAAKGARGPDLTLIDRVRRSSPPWPARLLPAWKSDVELLALAKSAPADFVAGALLATAAGLTAGAFKASPWPGWEEPNPIFVGLVGPSGSAKTPALEAVIDEVDAVERELWLDYEMQLDVWRVEAQVAKVRGEAAPPKPAAPLLKMADTTPEALCVALSKRRVGLLEVWAEGSSWANALTRYSAGTTTATGARGLQLEKFDAKDATYSRRKTGDEPLRLRLASAMVAGWQPDVVGHFLAGCRALRDGLDARWFFIRPDATYVPGPTATPAPYEAARARLRRAIHRLHEAGLAAGADVNRARAWSFALEPAARGRFKDWRWAWVQRIVAESGGAPSGWDAKAPGAALRLACAARLLEWAAGDEPVLALRTATIGEAAIEAAIEARATWLAQHRARVEAEAGQPIAEQLAETLARWAVFGNVTAIDTVGLRRFVCLPGLRTPEALLAALQELQACRWLKAGQTLPADIRRETLPPEVLLEPAVVALARDHLKLG